MLIGLSILSAAIWAGLALADFRAEIVSRYSTWDRAYRMQDTKTLVSILHPRFRIVTLSGKVISRANYVKGLGKGKEPEEYRTTVLRMEMKNGRALAWTKEISKQPDGDAHIHRYRDTWAKSKGHWKLLESRTLAEEKATLEGGSNWRLDQLKVRAEFDVLGAPFSHQLETAAMQAPLRLPSR